MRAVVATLAGLVLLVAAPIPGAAGHPAKPPPPPAFPPREVEEIPDGDLDQYRSRVQRIEPRVAGLRARIIGNQERLEVGWRGRTPLIVLGTQDEPMIRMSSRGIEVNELSATAYLIAERYGRVALPATADPSAPPQWRLIESPGRISWYEHRAQWMEGDRPEVVGDGAEGIVIFHWQVPARLGDREVLIRGSLEWLPDAEAIREERSEVSRPLLSAAILGGAMALGWLAGILMRRRLEDDRTWRAPGST